MKKQISTEQNASNIQEVLQLLAGLPARLETLSKSLTDEQLHIPPAKGERTPTEVLAHMLHCEEITTQAIYLALLVNEPLLPNIHPERDLGTLLQFNRLSFQELLAYYKIRRRMLMQILESLNEKKWARLVREEKKARKETVFWKARGQALHELEHVLDLETKLSQTK